MPSALRDPDECYVIHHKSGVIGPGYTYTELRLISTRVAPVHINAHAHGPTALRTLFLHYATDDDLKQMIAVCASKRLNP